MASTSNAGPASPRWFAPSLNVLVGMVVQGLLLVMLAIGGVALIHATNPSTPPENARSVDNDLATWIIVGVVLVGAVPWLSLLVTRWMGGLGGAGTPARTTAIVLWLVMFAVLIAIAALAAAAMALSAIVCPVDAYECPL